MHTELTTYTSNVTETRDNLEELQSISNTISTVVDTAGLVVAGIKKFKRVMNKTEQGFETTEVVLEILGFVSPLKTPVNILKKVIDKAEKPVEKVNEKIDTLSNKDDKKTAKKEEKDEFIEKLDTALENTGLAVDVVQDAFTITHFNLTRAIDATTNFKPALEVALRTGVAWEGLYAGLNTDVEFELGEVNPNYAAVNDLYNSIKADLDSFLDIFRSIDFQKIYGQIVDMDAIEDILKVLETPLDIARAAIEPIKPLLNAISSLISLIVDPIIDFVTEKLGIDHLLDEVADFIDRLLPDINLLDELIELAQSLKDDLDRFITDQFQQLLYDSQIDEVLFRNGDIALADKGATGWGSMFTDVLTGDAEGDILDGLGGVDILIGGGGNDILIAGEGSDILNGGSGADMFYFDYSFSEYSIARGDKDNPDEKDDFYFTHLVPKNPDVSTGRDIIKSLEDEDHVVFSDISFTGTELLNAIIGPSVLEGDINYDGTPESYNDLIFLETGSSSTVSDAFGFNGDDRIFGTIYADRLFGGAGNDTLLPGRGADQVFGGSGNDTYQVLEGIDATYRIDLSIGQALSNAGNDTLDSIENLVIAPDRRQEIQANDQANSIVTGDEGDIVSALGGDDLIEVNGGLRDYVIAGDGSDTVKGGLGRDVMFSGSRAVAGVVDIYIGGDEIAEVGQDVNELIDVVSYSNDITQIRDDILKNFRDTTLESRLKDWIRDYDDSQRVIIRGDTGLIERIDNKGRVITVDITEGVEGFVGSDMGDILHGGDIAEVLHGGGGNDKIFINSTTVVAGGTGDDRFVMTEKPTSPNTLYAIDGGAGTDYLDLTPITDLRWSFEITNATTLSLTGFQTNIENAKDLTWRASGYDITFEDAGLQGVSGRVAQLKPYRVDVIEFGDHNDHVVHAQEGSADITYYMLGGDDFYDSKNGTSTVFGGDGNDVGTFAGAGAGSFYGGAGDDYAYFTNNDADNVADMGKGDDFVLLQNFFGVASGGQGFDAIAFNPGAGGVTVRLTENTATGSQFNMTLSGFEEIIGSTRNDFFTGSSNEDTLVGRGGNDRMEGWAGGDKVYGGDGDDEMYGGGGDDLLHGGSGSDKLFGGTGRDTVSYSWTAPDNPDGSLRADNFGGVTVDLVAGTASGSHGNDELEGFENIFGSNGNDTLRGNDGKNVLTGEDGDDTLVGRGGDDVLVTGKGTDVALGGDGDDTVVIGLGDKILEGGEGEDTLDFGTVDGTVYIDFNAGTYTAQLEDSRPIWLDEEMMTDEMGEREWDAAGVSYSPEEVWRARNPFQITGSSDVNRPLPDEDDPEFTEFLIREEKFLIESSGVFEGFEKVIGGVAGANIILTTGFEHFDGSNSDRDVIDMGNSASGFTYNFQTGFNDIVELLGDEVTGIEGVQGGFGQDRLIGDARDNILRGGFESDFLKGSAGDDEMSGNQDDDIVQGGTGDDLVRGGSGNDDVYGDDGNDSVQGDSGDDFLFGGAGDDYLNGGDGQDTASYRFANAAIEVDLRTTGRIEVGANEGSDLLNSIENLEGSKYSDWLSGDNGDNTLWGGVGRDELWGQEGNDKLRGGDGRDSVRGGQGDDDMRGDGGNDYLTGNRGDDMLDGGAGDDFLAGDSGFDTACYVSASGGVYVDLRVSGRDVGGGQGRDSFDSIENILGSSHADRLIGTTGNNTIGGGNGNDIIKGKGGNDTLIGNKGNDRLIGSEGDDLLQGGDDSDVLVGLGGNDTLQGQSGDDFLYGGRDGDYLLGGTGNDVVRGNRGDDDILGGQGNDDLRGGGDSDFINGGTGDDFIFGDNGVDSINGGTGNDVLRGGSSGSGGDGFRDLFVFDTASGMDVIRDFENNLDKFDVSAYGFGSFAALQAVSEDRSSGLKIDLGDGNEIFIDNMSRALLTSDDVIL